MADLPLTHRHPVNAAKGAPALRLSLLTRALGVWRQRKHLDRLDAHMRRDIGVSDAQVRREVDRAIWDVPASWRY